MWFSGLVNGKWQNRAGFGLGCVSLKIPGKIQVAVSRKQLNMCLFPKERSV